MPIETIPITSREQWLAARTQDITASDVSALNGRHKFRSRYQLWAEKRGLIQPNTDDNVMMRRGRILEPAVAEAAREEYPLWQIEKCHDYLRDTERRLGATPDYIVNTPDTRGAPMECKLVLPEIFEQDWGGGTVAPVYYQAQVNVQRRLLGADTGFLGVLVADFKMTFHAFEIPADPGFDRWLDSVTAEFWRDVKEGREPDKTAVDLEVLKRQYPASAPGSVKQSMSNYLVEALAKRERLKAQIKPLEADVGAIDAALLAEAGTAEVLELPGWRVRWSQIGESVSTRKAHRRMNVKKA